MLFGYVVKKIVLVGEDYTVETSWF